jgi:hypothetical protein
MLFWLELRRKRFVNVAACESFRILDMPERLKYSPDCVKALPL